MGRCCCPLQLNNGQGHNPSEIIIQRYTYNYNILCSVWKTSTGESFACDGGDLSPSYETTPKLVDILDDSREYIEEGASETRITTSTDEEHVQRVDAISAAESKHYW